MPQIGGFRGGTRKRRIDKLAGQDNLRSLIERAPPSWPILAAGRTAVMTSAKIGEWHLAGKAWYWTLSKLAIWPPSD